jgi:hypothetical protein
LKLKDLLEPLAKLGLPILGTAVAGPAGAAVATALANHIGAPKGNSEVSDVDSLAAVLTGSVEAQQKAREFEATHGRLILEMHLNALAQSDAGQVALVKGDQQKSLYDRGWRPGAAWLCVGGMFYTFTLRPLLPWILTVAGVDGVPPLPAIDTTELFVMLGGLLGLGTMRHIERVKGKA